MELFILLVFSLCCCYCQAVPVIDLEDQDNDFLNAIELALKGHDARREEGNALALERILEVSREAGPYKTWIVKYQVRETTCAVGDYDSSQRCKFIAASEGDSGNCTAIIHIDISLDLVSIQQTCNIISAPRRAATSQSACPGCWNSMDPKSLELLPVVRYTAEQFNNQSNEPALFDVKEILKAKSQVVAGRNYKIEFLVKGTNCVKAQSPVLTPACRTIPQGREGTCTASVSVDLTDNIVKATHKCTLQVPPPSRPCIGCRKEILADAPELQRPLAVAVEMYNTESNDDFHFKAEEIEKATVQIVAGLIYQIDFSIRKTNCSKAEFPKLNEYCTSTEGSQPLNCQASIYEIPWESKITPTVKCTEEETKEHQDTCRVNAYVDPKFKMAHLIQTCKYQVNENVPTPAPVCDHCPINIATDSPELEKPVAAALEEYNSKSHVDFYYKLEEITKAKAQVVAGIIYSLEFSIRKTSCPKAEFSELNENCTDAEDSQPINCHASIYERPWESKIAVIVTCKDGQPTKHKGTCAASANVDLTNKFVHTIQKCKHHGF
ncbi:T-kininogen 1-like [Elgaria multicarinata webbii]|uniref:T-kininogen 1-like n=1 Tax=Elgaria multicarinata webbii TaxID=159646 RepID=UPI002FCD1832